jgi:hypothetical protein
MLRTAAPATTIMPEMRALNDRAQLALDNTHKAVPFSTNNAPYKKELTSFTENEIAEKKRQAGISVRFRLSNAACSKVSMAKSDEELCFRILDGIVAEATQHGNCGSLAAFALSELIIMGINGNTELINIDITTDDGQEDGHTFILLNRDIKQSDIKRPETWKNTILLDPWGSNSVRVFMDSTAPKMEDVALLKGTVTNIQSHVRLTQNLTQNQCEKICQYLCAAKEELCKGEKTRVILDRISDFFQSIEPNFTESFRQNLITILDTKIALYRRLANTPIVSNEASLGTPAPSSTCLSEQKSTHSVGVCSPSGIIPPVRVTANKFAVLFQYIEDRKQEYTRTQRQYNRFWGRLTGMSYALKISAAQKMLNLLQHKQRCEFSNAELEALREGRLGKVIAAYEQQRLLPHEFTRQENIRILSDSRLLR